MQWKNKMEKWQYLAGSREVQPAPLAGIGEGIAARGSISSLQWVSEGDQNIPS